MKQPSISKRTGTRQKPQSSLHIDKFVNYAMVFVLANMRLSSEETAQLIH